ncbi:MAG: hypothetical protein NT166_00390 [Candidatus Aminicenantes bacterium]|nr:hypothetical protein [Candidatus Aminicenantes bacterium]
MIKLRATELAVRKEAGSFINTSLLLFQTGYLTIKKHEGETYVLSYPNREVENAFLYNLVEEFSGK